MGRVTKANLLEQIGLDREQLRSNYDRINEQNQKIQQLEKDNRHLNQRAVEAERIAKEAIAILKSIEEIADAELFVAHNYGDSIYYESERPELSREGRFARLVSQKSGWKTKAPF